MTMKTYARVQYNQVAELTRTDRDITQLFHPDLLWIEVDGTVEVGDTYSNGVFAKPAETSASQPVLSQILALEAQVTQRRIREAVLGTDNGWLAELDAQIAALRAQL